jgi:hypothetical protein
MMPARDGAPGRGRLSRALRSFRLWLRRTECKDNGHRPRSARFRERHSRFHVEMTVCMDCGQLLEAEGRRSFRV